MLFKASITPETLLDEEKLAEQLYIFLEDFVKSKLKYEDINTVEDCIQDTVFYLILKARKLLKEEIKTLNLEKYMYNRANSYIGSIWLGKLKKHRQRYLLSANGLVASIKDNPDAAGYYIEEEFITKQSTFNKKQKENKDYTYLDRIKLDDIIEDYRLDTETEEAVLNTALLKLSNQGFLGIDELYPTETNDTIEVIATAVVDEYLAELIDYNTKEN